MKKNRLNFIHSNISINFLFHLALDIIMAEAYEKVYTIQIAHNSLSQYIKETHVDNECKNNNKLTHTCQDDTISCGVYVCFFVKKLVKRQKELLSDHV
jgi:hypothetical protein